VIHMSENLYDLFFHVDMAKKRFTQLTRPRKDS
jgi:hypothetical protein